MIILNGDVFTAPFDAIAHQVNCRGVMNSGVAKTVRERYPEAFDAYKKLCDETPNPFDLLGKGQCVPTGHGDNKNEECSKTGCLLNGEECGATTNKEYAVIDWRTGKPILLPEFNTMGIDLSEEE